MLLVRNRNEWWMERLNFLIYELNIIYEVYFKFDMCAGERCAVFVTSSTWFAPDTAVVLFNSEWIPALSFQNILQVVFHVAILVASR